MKRTFLGLVPLALVVATLAPGCGDSGVGTSAANSTETGSGDGDGDNSTGDGDGTPGDGDGTPGDGDGTPGDGDGAPGPDSDMDGVPDASDNCPDDPNPNQLDFDGNGMGNVCDVQMFTNVTGMLNTSANADGGVLGMCTIPLMLEVTGGQVLVQLDDDAAVAMFEITQLQLADVPDQNCMLLVSATVSLSNFTIDTNGAFPVSMPHSQAMHDGGQIAGMSDMPHPVTANADMAATVMGQPPVMNPLMLDGSLPVFTANITGAGSMGTLSWAAPMDLIAETDFMVTMPIMANIHFTLTGLTGTLNIAP